MQVARRTRTIVSKRRSSNEETRHAMQVLVAIFILTIRSAFAAPGLPLAAPGLPFAAYGPPSTLHGVEDLGSRRAPEPAIVFEFRTTPRPSIPDREKIPRVETPNAAVHPSRREEYPYPTASQPTRNGFDDSSQELVLPSEQQQPQPQPQPQPQQQQQPQPQQQPISSPETSPSKSPAIILPPGTKLKLEDDRGQYSHGFSSPDGTEVQETGHLITTNGGWEYVIAKEGSYKYNSPEGVPITVRYVADHNGYRIIDQSYGR